MDFNRLALVTGGSGGIGRSICKMLLKEGYVTVFLDINEKSAKDFLENSNSDQLHFLACDVSNSSQVIAVCDKVQKEFGTVSVLVNNAGIQTHMPFLEMTPQIWHQTIDIDLNSMFYLSRALAPAMVKQGYGRIVNLSSMSAIRGSNRHVHYNTAKAGVLGFTRGLSYELAPKGITVNAICPGVVNTEIVQDYVQAKTPEWLSQMHVKRLGEPEDISAAVRYLVSEDASWITGQAIHVNGGILTP